jgi:hypothetical protein
MVLSRLVARQMESGSAGKLAVECWTPLREEMRMRVTRGENLVARVDDSPSSFLLPYACKPGSQSVSFRIGPLISCSGRWKNYTIAVQCNVLLDTKERRNWKLPHPEASSTCSIGRIHIPGYFARHSVFQTATRLMIFRRPPLLHRLKEPMKPVYTFARSMR